MDTTDLLAENVLTVMQRRQRAINTKRRQPQLKRAREVAARKLAPEEVLIRRARLKARQILRKKFAGKQGENYSTLSPAARVQVDKLIEKKLPAIERLVKRLLPMIRREERERLKRRRRAKTAGKQATATTSSMVSTHVPIREMIEQAELAVLDQFVDFVCENDLAAYQSFFPVGVVEDIAINSVALDTNTLDALLEDTSVATTVSESIGITPAASISNPMMQYATLFHPEKLHYHVELVKLAPGENLRFQPAVAARLEQGYQLVNQGGGQQLLDMRNKYFGRRARMRATDD